MCGIIGYIGKQQALPIILDGLRAMEYRGYDSSGVAVVDTGGAVALKRSVGRVALLEEKLFANTFVGTTGIGHCLHPSTIVQLADGSVRRIKDIHDNSEVVSVNPDDARSSRGKTKVFSHVAPAHLYGVHTPVSTFIATGEHQTLVYSQGVLQTKKIKDLAKGDFLPSPQFIAVQGQESLHFLPTPMKRYYRLTADGHIFFQNRFARTRKALLTAKTAVSSSYIEHIAANDRNFQEEKLQRLYQYFGLDFDLQKSIHLEPVNTIHGKFLHLPEKSSVPLMQILGYFIGDGYAGERSLRFKDMDRSTLERYRELIQREFNVEGRIVNMRDTAAGLLECNSFYLCEWLKKNVKENHDAFISSLGHLPNEELAAFIRGLFDAEGCVALTSRQLAIAMTDEFLIRALQLYLLRFGIIASFKEEKTNLHQRRPRISYRLSISNKDSLQRFRKHIGFGGPIKTGKLNTLIDSVGNKKFSFRVLDGTNLILSRVKEVRKIPADIDTVFDLEVAPHQNFLANGIFTHNSRWATHGGVTEQNAHPHSDCSGEISLCHNGIIENFRELKDGLITKGHSFTSETDSEVIPHLIEEEMKGNVSFQDAFFVALSKIKGTYGIVAVSAKNSDILLAARNFSPLLVGVGDGERFVASDASAILKHTPQVVYLDDGEVAILTATSHAIYDRSRVLRKKPEHKIEWSLEEAKKGGFSHFMEKEIFEEPEAIENSIRGRMILGEGRVKLGGLRDKEEILRLAKRILISACGTAYFAGRVGEYMLEEYAGIPTEVDIASEFRYRKPVFREGDVFFVISQSGETADTLAAIREAKEKGVPAFGIVNVVGSTIARETDAGVYQHVGPEIGVASTKAFTSQVAILALLSVYLGRQREMSLITGERVLQELVRIPDLMRRVIEKNSVLEIAKKYLRIQNFFFLGRKYNFPVALEGALKLKEVSYVHAEGIAAGELKHGAIAMIDKNILSIVIAPHDSVYEKMISTIQEIKARGGPVLAIATEGDSQIAELADDVIFIPKTLEMLTPLLSVVPLQLFAYYFGVAKGLDVDKPRNLAKSVTVE